ncbi:MAG: class I tRNA ligase family protein [Candidatus Nanoarchaeia archaeon]|nr:class I tRNA ligase family protein [Candidatus Nanoarchaeia archaeon]MDD5587977.1 class I tRNA ligase family protein [Candidatus Nanoarchaeia archaeon]
MVNKLLKIDKKWQKAWEDKKAFKVKEDPKKKKYYVLEMYPYPSASFLHMGHVRNYTIGDIYARFKRMQGFNILYPMGYDSFGLPAETAAKKEGIHPKKYAESSIKKIMEYQKALGNSYDWSRILSSHDVNYYKWNQYFFLKLFEKGLTYRKNAPVNWCEKCQSVLANEESEGGKCWRCDSEVVQKPLEQWFFKITAYADRLLNDLNKIDWPEKIKLMQKNWIGKSHGTEILFKINNENWPIFTTRADTIYGVTFMVISAQHPKLFDLVTKEQKKDVDSFLKKLKTVSKEELEELEKEGVFTGSYAINPITKEKVPVYAGNFVIADYGSGMVMAVPAHDQRDFEFAKKYNIPIKIVIIPEKELIKEDDMINRMFLEIKKINELMQKNKIKVWFNGTFGVIGHSKKIFIKPRDVDFGVLEKDYEKAKKLLVGLGYSKIEEKENEKFKYTSYKYEDLFLEVGTFDHDLGNEVANIKGITYPIPNARWLAECYEITKNKERRQGRGDDFSALLLGLLSGSMKEAFTGNGTLINSKEFNGTNNLDAIEEITKHLEKLKLGKKVTQYKLRDWMISRQRYWGTPIPIIYCDKCGVVPVPEKDLPVTLPEKVKFDTGNPLSTNKEFVNVKCPKCKGPGRRETDTMGGFVDSSWYFIRFCDNTNKKQPFDKKKANYWMPVDQYIGGAEHAVMHLMYARFFVKALKDLGIVSFDEPFSKLFNQGIVYKDGAKMSKSKGNVVYQTEISEKYGIDTARLFLMSIAAPDAVMEWRDEGVESSFKFINKVITYYENVKLGKSSEKVESKLNKTIKEVTEDIESFNYNIAIIKIRKLFESFNKEESKNTLEPFLKLFHPFCPHITEELWSKLKNKEFLSLEDWPKADLKKINEKFEQEDKLIDNLTEDINNVVRIIKEKGNEPKKVFIYTIPKEKEIYSNEIESIKLRTTLDVEVFAVNDPKKHDPQNKAIKSKPGKPALYLE